MEHITIKKEIQDEPIEESFDINQNDKSYKLNIICREDNITLNILEKNSYFELTMYETKLWYTDLIEKKKFSSCLDFLNYTKENIAKKTYFIKRLPNNHLCLEFEKDSFSFQLKTKQISTDIQIKYLFEHVKNLGNYVENLEKKYENLIEENKSLKQRLKKFEDNNKNIILMDEYVKNVIEKINQKLNLKANKYDVEKILNTKQKKRLEKIDEDFDCIKKDIKDIKKKNLNLESDIISLRNNINEKKQILNTKKVFNKNLDLKENSKMNPENLKTIQNDNKIIANNPNKNLKPISKEKSSARLNPKFFNINANDEHKQNNLFSEENNYNILNFIPQRRSNQISLNSRNLHKGINNYQICDSINEPKAKNNRTLKKNNSQLKDLPIKDIGLRSGTHNNFYSNTKLNNGIKKKFTSNKKEILRKKTNISDNHKLHFPTHSNTPSKRDNRLNNKFNQQNRSISFEKNQLKRVNTLNKNLFSNYKKFKPIELQNDKTFFEILAGLPKLLGE